MVVVSSATEVAKVVDSVAQDFIPVKLLLPTIFKTPTVVVSDTAREPDSSIVDSVEDESLDVVSLELSLYKFGNVVSLMRSSDDIVEDS